MKPIRISNHARGQLKHRGATEQEVVETIRSSTWKPVRHDRLECFKDYPFQNDWNGKFYMTKKVKPIFVNKPNGIVVVTVYLFCF